MPIILYYMLPRYAHLFKKFLLTSIIKLCFFCIILRDTSSTNFIQTLFYFFFLLFFFFLWNDIYTLMWFFMLEKNFRLWRNLTHINFELNKESWSDQQMYLYFLLLLLFAYFNNCILVTSITWLHYVMTIKFVSQTDWHFPKIVKFV